MSIITSVVAHIDHGKTTLLDSLLSYTNTISYISAGDLRYLDTRGDEQSRGITLKLSVITIPDIKMTFIDTPGHIDLHHYVLDCNSLVDTTLLLIDANEGITPRTFSLLTNKPTTIFINKIDKLLSLSFEDALFRIEEIICRIQGMFDQKFSKNVNLFDWKKNNVILGSTKYCFGVNFHIFSKFKRESTIKSLLFFVFKIKEALEQKKDLNIFKENKITSFNLKGVFGKLFPICESIFFSNKTIFKAVKENKFTSLISTYSINYSEKILFVTRMFGGFIRKEDLFLCVDYENNVSFVKLENIFVFRNERLEEIYEFEGSGLIGLQGKFSKKCNLFKLEEISQKINISEKEILEMKIEKEDFFKNNLKNNKEKLISFIFKYKHPLPEERIPFYSKIIILNNLNELFLFKELFKKIGKTESSLSVILNKFNEFEINTQGKVHLEKILYDFNNLYEKTDTLSEIKLINHGKGFFLTEKQGSFVEGSSKSINFTNQEIELKIEPIENEECEFKGSTDLSESILINFINTGLLIKEKIKFTKFFLKTDLQDYSKIKNYLAQWYKESEPMIISQHIKIHCDIPDDHLNNLYPLINTYDGLSQVISYDDYYKIEVILPVIFYNDFIEKVSINCKGTVYLQPKEYLFIKRQKNLFKKYEEEIKIKKGIEMLSLEE